MTLMTDVGLLETLFRVQKTTFKIFYDHYLCKGGCSVGCYDFKSNVKIPKCKDVIKHIHMYMFYIYVINGIKLFIFITDTPSK
jgi:hypothetical protein